MPELIHPVTGAPVDLADHALEAGLVRLSVLGAEGFELSFDDPAVAAAIAACIGDDGGASPFSPALLRPHAERGLAALEAAAPDDPRLGRLLALWRPRALVLAGRAEDVTKEEVHLERLRVRLLGLWREMEEARAAGDDDRADALHARYVELGTTFVGRLSSLWE